MFIQPNVEVVPGEARRLDDVIGGRFALISWRCDPLAQAPAALLEMLARLECGRFVGVRARSSRDELGAAEQSRNAVTVLEDVENDMHFWFERRRVDWVLIRPDRFVAAVGSESDAVAQLTSFCDKVLAPGASTADEFESRLLREASAVP